MEYARFVDVQRMIPVIIQIGVCVGGLMTPTSSAVIVLILR